MEATLRNLPALTDAQICMLDLLARAHVRGVAAINRHELLGSDALPAVGRVRLVFAALTMPADLISIANAHDFSITAAGLEVHAALVGTPSRAADHIIALPDRSHERLH
ncbi:hypothetical protein [Shinella sp.]|jgi:hypothetical protein|uniref:hypothetical protein n=1 Tax=Shinella sp. TaxID=1870904 RepID=UPI003F72ACBB